MTLKRKLIVPLVVSSTLLACGCQAVQPARPSQVSQTPLIVDDAMQMRDWPQISARYEGTSVIAGHNGTMWQYTPEMQAKEGWARVLDVPLFLLNTVTMPFSLFYDKPAWREHNSRSPALEPSHHAMPPLPPYPAKADHPAPSSDPEEREPSMPDPVDPPPAQPLPAEPSTRPND
jgi:uncharacterized protein YceK